MSSCQFLQQNLHPCFQSSLKGVVPRWRDSVVIKLGYPCGKKGTNNFEIGAKRPEKTQHVSMMPNVCEP